MQATLAIEREQTNHSTTTEAPAANPLDFDVAVPDMSKARATFALQPQGPEVICYGQHSEPQRGVFLQTVLGIILGGGAGSRLYPLTKKRAKPAVPLGANYRLIDIPVSNCINSNVNKIYCLTQFNSASLNRHLSQAYVSFLLS